MQYPTPEEDDSYLMVAEDDATAWTVAMTRITIERILKQPLKNRGDMIALWMFYAYTARFQNTAQAKADVCFVAKGLGWGLDKVRTTRKRLLDMKLIEDVKRLNERKEVVGWYVRVRYLVNAKEYEQKVIRYTDFSSVKTHPRENPQGGKSDANA